jgi:hypothetical protein
VYEGPSCRRSNFEQVSNRTMEIDRLKSPGANPGIVTIPQDGESQNVAPERRRDVRYKCAGSAEFHTDGIHVRTSAAVSDISRSGCYVELQATSAVNTLVDLLITVNGIGVRVKGVVRTSYPLLGMGIAFTEVSEEAQAQLEELILSCAGGTSPPVAPESNAGQSSPAAPDLLMIMDAGAALNALAKFFQNGQTLTREEFSLLVSKSQSRDADRKP